MKLLQQNQKILDAKKYSIEPDIIVRASTSYFLPQNPRRLFNEDHHKTIFNLIPLKSKNKQYKIYILDLSTTQ